MSAPRSSFLHPDSADRHGSSNPASPSAPASAVQELSDYYSYPKPTYATFSPATTISGASTAAAAAKRRSTILVHQKSPLLLATPPQITRALAYSHPFLLPLNKAAGLLSWTTGDPWESFVMVLVWWGIVLYGDAITRNTGPICLVLTLIAGMYGRRYSPLSTSGWSTEDAAVSGGSASGGSGSSGGGGSGGANASSSGGSGLGYFLFGIGGGGGSSSNNNSNNGTSGNAQTKNGGRGKNLSLDSNGVKAMMAEGGNGNGNGGSGGGGGTHQRALSEVVTPTRHQKTLDEIVDTLKEFTARCNLLLEPLLELTDFLSTQSTPTSATTRPALTVLFVRILLCTPFWYVLTLPPLRIVTTQRVALVFGTVILTWHSRVMRVSRTILWRSASIRRATALVTGLEFEGPMRPTKTPPYVTAGGGGAGATPASDAVRTSANAAAALQSKLSGGGNGNSGSGGGKLARRLSTPRESELTKAIRRARAGHDAGVRFTFILYENQRRWVGLGWTTSLFAYERPAWTDEHNNPVPSKDEFELPEVEDGSRMRWRWVEGSRWRVDGVLDEAVRVETVKRGEHVDTWDYDSEGGRMGWVYYDNKWQSGRRGQDSWNRWTRRRKWYRDAELVEVDADELSAETAAAGEVTPTSSHPSSLVARPPSPSPSHSGTVHTTTSATSTASSQVLATDSAVDGANDANGDTASIFSTSSKSGRTKPPSFRRRVTDSSTRSVLAPVVMTTATATAIPTNAQGRTRQDDEAAREEEAASLSTSAGVKLHETGKGSWGIGDEALMGLD